MAIRSFFLTTTLYAAKSVPYLSASRNCGHVGDDGHLQRYVLIRAVYYLVELCWEQRMCSLVWVVSITNTEGEMTGPKMHKPYCNASRLLLPCTTQNKMCVMTVPRIATALNFTIFSP